VNTPELLASNEVEYEAVEDAIHVCLLCARKANNQWQRMSHTRDRKQTGNHRPLIGDARDVREP
jgi:hypothetical protein